MKKIIYIVLVFIGCMPVFAQLNPQTRNITNRYFPNINTVKNVTPALQKKKGYTNYEELISFLENVESKNKDKVSISYIGVSQKGKQIPMVKMTNPNGKEKIKVWMQGGLHGNEPASTEGLLYLMHKLTTDDSYTFLLDDIELVIVPMANIDGYEKQNRYAANGLDLNRDQTKLMAPESRSLKEAFIKFNPEVGVDFHEYRPYRRDLAMMGDFGLTAAYDVMFLYSGNLNVPENLRKVTSEIFVGNAKKELDKHNLTYHPYVSTGDYAGEVHFNQGSLNSRSSATNYALSNTISTLVEVRGVGVGKTSFKRRVFTTFSVGISFLETTTYNKSLVKETIKKAIEDKNNLAYVTHIRPVYKDKLEVIDLNTENKIAVEVIKRDALKAAPDIVRKRPKAYYFDGSLYKLAQKLRILGVYIQRIPTDREKLAETYTVTYYDKDYEKYEKMNQQEVRTKVVQVKRTFKRGTFEVLMDQENADIIVELLEPEAPNSFVSFGVLKTKQGAELPIYRILN